MKESKKSGNMEEAENALDDYEYDLVLCTITEKSNTLQEKNKKGMICC